MKATNIDSGAIVNAIHSEMPAFSELMQTVPYERKGVLYSEMLFLKACASLTDAKRVLESGRARGQSTLLLAKLFPSMPIVSVEHDPNSPDVSIAAARLSGFSNVDLRFGDATALLPAIAQEGDIVLIDGPKGHRGVRMALTLLASGKVPLVFLHDTVIGGPERAFLERALPSITYSDDSTFADHTHDLDSSAQDDLPAVNRYLDGKRPVEGYGYSLACIPYDPACNYRWLLVKTVLDGFLHRLLRR